MDLAVDQVDLAVDQVDLVVDQVDLVVVVTVTFGVRIGNLDLKLAQFVRPK